MAGAERRLAAADGTAASPRPRGEPAAHWPAADQRDSFTRTERSAVAFTMLTPAIAKTTSAS
eukprot:14829185-Alexandrium_andersonii.AAC.1